MTASPKQLETMLADACLAVLNVMDGRDFDLRTRAESLRQVCFLILKELSDHPAAPAATARGEIA